MLSYWRPTILEGYLRCEVTSPGHRRPIVLDDRNSHGLRSDHVYQGRYGRLIFSVATADQKGAKKR